jgi:hypothetical protein
MKKHAVIMTFPSHKWDVYGFCLKGFIENWPKEVQAYAVVEQPENIPVEIPSNVTVLDFNEVCGERQTAFELRNVDKGIMDMGTTGNIAVQAAKFARKAHAQLYVLENIDADVIWYIDADLYTHKPVSMEMLETLSSGDQYIGCTPRWWKPKGYTETGLMMWQKHMTEQHNEWVKRYAECYDNDIIFTYDAWHDCIAFDHATKSLLAEGTIQLADFGYGIRSSHPLVSGPLGAYFDHMKGQRKFAGFSKERVRVHGK